MTQAEAGRKQASTRHNVRKKRIFITSDWVAADLCSHLHRIGHNPEVVDVDTVLVEARVGLHPHSNPHVLTVE